MSEWDYVDIVFDGPPSHESGRFVEVEDSAGKSISFGEWIERPDGYWALRFPRSVMPGADPTQSTAVADLNPLVPDDAASQPKGSRHG